MNLFWNCSTRDSSICSTSCSSRSWFNCSKSASHSKCHSECHFHKLFVKMLQLLRILLCLQFKIKHLTWSQCHQWLQTYPPFCGLHQEDAVEWIQNFELIATAKAIGMTTSKLFNLDSIFKILQRIGINPLDINQHEAKFCCNETTIPFINHFERLEWKFNPFKISKSEFRIPMKL